jgi:hypothetical protein
LQLYADANGCLSLSITQDLGNSSCGYSGPSSTHSRLNGSWASTLDLRLDDVAPWMDGSMVAVGFSPEGRAVFVRDASGWSPTQLPNVGFPPRGITANTNGKLWLHDRSRLIEYVE